MAEQVKELQQLLKDTAGVVASIGKQTSGVESKLQPEGTPALRQVAGTAEPLQMIPMPQVVVPPEPRWRYEHRWYAMDVTVYPGDNGQVNLKVRTNAHINLDSWKDRPSDQVYLSELLYTYTPRDSGVPEAERPARKAVFGPLAASGLIGYMNSVNVCLNRPWRINWPSALHFRAAECSASGVPNPWTPAWTTAEKVREAPDSMGLFSPPFEDPAQWNTGKLRCMWKIAFKIPYTPHST
jgi:hypothetical protein